MYDKEKILERVYEGLLNGFSLRQICLQPDMPNKSTILRWLDSNDEYASNIARARDLQAESLFDDMTEIINEMLIGKIDATTAKTAIWAKQWQASKLRPKKYGDRVLTENQALDKNGQPADQPIQEVRITFADAKPDNTESI